MGALEWNSFNNLVILTRWWLQNFIVGHAFKKLVQVLFSSNSLRVYLQSIEKGIKFWVNIIFKKAKLYAVFIKINLKVAKKLFEKLSKKKWLKKGIFNWVTMSKSFLPLDFFGMNFVQCFQRLRNQHNIFIIYAIVQYRTHIERLKKKIFFAYITVEFLQTLTSNAQKMALRNEKTSFVVSGSSCSMLKTSKFLYPNV